MWWLTEAVGVEEAVGRVDARPLPVLELVVVVVGRLVVEVKVVLGGKARPGRVRPVVAGVVAAVGRAGLGVQQRLDGEHWEGERGAREHGRAENLLDAGAKRGQRIGADLEEHGHDRAAARQRDSGALRRDGEQGRKELRQVDRLHQLDRGIDRARPAQRR